MTGFDALLAAMAADCGDLVSAPGDDWRQGRTLFGGMSAALCVAACRRAVPDLPPLRAGQVAFIGPAAGTARMTPQLLRRGKSVSFMGCDLHAEGQLAVRATLAFGAARESVHAGAAPPAPLVPPPEACQDMWPAGFGPQFRQHLDQRRAGGEAMVSGAARGDLLVWVRHRDKVAPTEAALVALADALPPASFTRFTAPAMISTVVWQFDLFAPISGDDGAGWVLMRSTDDGVGEGYAGQDMAMWAPDGRPILRARQSVAIFA